MRVDAAVDHGYADAGPVPTGLPGGVCTDGLGGDVEGAGQRAIGRHISDLRVGGHRPDLSRRQEEVDSLDVLESPYNLVRGYELEIGIGRYVVELHDNLDVSFAAEHLLKVAGQVGTGHCQSACHKGNER